MPHPQCPVALQGRDRRSTRRPLMCRTSHPTSTRCKSARRLTCRLQLAPPRAQTRLEAASRSSLPHASTRVVNSRTAPTRIQMTSTTLATRRPTRLPAARSKRGCALTPRKVTRRGLRPYLARLRTASRPSSTKYQTRGARGRALARAPRRRKAPSL